MWQWVERIKQFISSKLGRLSKPAQERLSRAVVQDHALSIKEVTSRWADGRLGIPAWHKAMRADLKNLYIQNYLLGRGGKAQLTPADYGSIGGMLKEQYRYLDNFAKELVAGTVTPAQAAMRAEMYARSAKEAHERGKARAWGEAADIERWIVAPMLEHCEDCLAFEAQGWQPRGNFPFPGAGETRCLTNCGCHKEYGAARPGKSLDIGASTENGNETGSKQRPSLMSPKHSASTGRSGPPAACRR